MGFVIAEECGTVMCEAAVTSLGFFKEILASLWETESSSLLGSLGSLGVGLKRSGCAIWASRVSNGNNDAFGSPGQRCQSYRFGDADGIIF